MCCFLIRFLYGKEIRKSIPLFPLIMACKSGGYIYESLDHQNDNIQKVLTACMIRGNRHILLHMWSCYTSMQLWCMAGWRERKVCWSSILLLVHHFLCGINGCYCYLHNHIFWLFCMSMWVTGNKSDFIVVTTVVQTI